MDEGLSPRAALLELRAIYRKIDAHYAPFSCPASGECCQLEKTQRPPWLWTPEWLMLTERLREDGRELPPARPDGGCPFLDASGVRCSVYADRPFGCRTFFCGRRQGPKREPADELIALSRRLEFLSQRLDPELMGPRPIGEWIDEARSGAGEHIALSPRS